MEGLDSVFNEIAVPQSASYVADILEGSEPVDIARAVRAAAVLSPTDPETAHGLVRRMVSAERNRDFMSAVERSDATRSGDVDRELESMRRFAGIEESSMDRILVDDASGESDELLALQERYYFG